MNDRYRLEYDYVASTEPCKIIAIQGYDKSIEKNEYLIILEFNELKTIKQIILKKLNKKYHYKYNAFDTPPLFFNSSAKYFSRNRNHAVKQRMVGINFFAIYPWEGLFAPQQRAIRGSRFATLTQTPASRGFGRLMDCAPLR
jgi:6-pyruvoyl-tetrahydropterin synthase